MLAFVSGRLGCNIGVSQSFGERVEGAARRTVIPMIWGKLFGRQRRSEKPPETVLGLDKRADKRRGPRVPAVMPVFVYGRVQGQPFSEHAETTNVSPQGGLLELSADVEGRQSLLVTNLQTNEELACRVARSTKTDKGKTLVGLEFLRPSPDFWTVDFSPRVSQ